VQLPIAPATDDVKFTTPSGAAACDGFSPSTTVITQLAELPRTIGFGSQDSVLEVEWPPPGVGAPAGAGQAATASNASTGSQRIMTRR
jgi:hypothetical protein